VHQLRGGPQTRGIFLETRAISAFIVLSVPYLTLQTGLSCTAPGDFARASKVEDFSPTKLGCSLRNSLPTAVIGREDLFVVRLIEFMHSILFPTAFCCDFGSVQASHFSTISATMVTNNCFTLRPPLLRLLAPSS